MTLVHVTAMHFQFQVNLFHAKHIYLALADAHDVFCLKSVLELTWALWWYVGDLFLTV